jgi:hypothetical protein
MHANTNLPADAAKEPDARLPVSIGIRIVGTVVRTLFLIILTALTARVASPQIETLSSLYETPDDLIRVALGFGVCIFFVVNLFILPKDPGAYRTWMYLGPAVLPLSLLCAFVVW